MKPFNYTQCGSLARARYVWVYVTVERVELLPPIIARVLTGTSVLECEKWQAPSSLPTSDNKAMQYAS
jgi:hypothetical protein